MSAAHAGAELITFSQASRVWNAADLEASHCAAGGISKTDIRRFLYWAADNLGYTELRGVVAALGCAGSIAFTQRPEVKTLQTLRQVVVLQVVSARQTSGGSCIGLLTTWATLSSEAWLLLLRVLSWSP